MYVHVRYYLRIRLGVHMEVLCRSVAPDGRGCVRSTVHCPVAPGVASQADCPTLPRNARRESPVRFACDPAIAAQPRMPTGYLRTPSMLDSLREHRDWGDSDPSLRTVSDAQLSRLLRTYRKSIACCRPRSREWSGPPSVRPSALGSHKSTAAGCERLVRMRDSKIGRLQTSGSALAVNNATLVPASRLTSHCSRSDTSTLKQG